MKALDNNIKDKIEQSKLSQPDKDRLVKLFLTCESNVRGVFFDPIALAEIEQLVRKM